MDPDRHRSLEVRFSDVGISTDMRIQGDCATVLQQVLDAVEARADDAWRRRVAERMASWSGAREAAGKRRATASANKASSARSTRPSCRNAKRKAVTGRHRPQRSHRNAPILQQHITRTKPQSYVGLAGGGLGFSGGMALGWKLAQPDRRIVQVIGDGGFISPRPTASMRWRSNISFQF